MSFSSRHPPLAVTQVTNPTALSEDMNEKWNAYVQSRILIYVFVDWKGIGQSGKDSATLRSANAIPWPRVEEMLASGKEELEKKEFLEREKKFSLERFYYRLVFCENELIA